MPELELNKKRTALVVIDLMKGMIDLMKGTTAIPTKPYTIGDVVKNAALLAEAFRTDKMPVFLVRVSMEPETRLKCLTDDHESITHPRSSEWLEFVSEIGSNPSDIVITKRQWGAFYGTDLELQLRRREIDTIVLCGVATDMGVESTARFAYEFGFQQVFAEDAMSSMSEEQHNAAVQYIFPKMGRVRKTEDILRALL